MNKQQLEGLLSLLQAGQVKASVILVQTALEKMEKNTLESRAYNRTQKAARRRVLKGLPPGPPPQPPPTLEIQPPPEPTTPPTPAGVQPVGGWDGLLENVLMYANSVADRKYGTKRVAHQYRSLMMQRARESYTEVRAEFPKESKTEHWQRVFNRMCIVWDEKIRQSTERRPGGRAEEMLWDRRYVRPETLYTGRFHSYVQEGIDRMNNGATMIEDAPVYPPDETNGQTEFLKD